MAYASIRVIFRDGTEETFRANPEAAHRGGLRLSYEPGVVRVIDEYGGARVFPLGTIKEVRECPII